MTVGACVHGFNMTNDHLMTNTEMVGLHDPPGMGRYCNMNWAGVKWDFALGPEDSLPCAQLRSNNSSLGAGTVLRAGLFSLTGFNVVRVECNNGSVSTSGVRSDPLVLANNLANSLFGQTNNECIFSISPSKMPVLFRPFALEGQTGGAAPFDHVYGPSTVRLEDFGLGEMGVSSAVDRTGRAMGTCEPMSVCTGDREQAYDLAVPEGVPVYAMRAGTVLANGSRDRNVTAFGCGGTAYQGELYVRYDIGASSEHQESFVGYYAHVRRRVVQNGQTVVPGQLLGFTGHNGCSSGPHLHFGMMRIRNINAHQAGNCTSSGCPRAYGYRPPFQTIPGDEGNSGRNLWNVDPFGWDNFNAPDPAGYLEFNTDTGFGWIGKGAWSIDLFIDGERPRL
jgi:hypothetical protein